MELRPLGAAGRPQAPLERRQLAPLAAAEVVVPRRLAERAAVEVVLEAVGVALETVERLEAAAVRLETVALEAVERLEAAAARLGAVALEARRVAVAVAPQTPQLR